MKYCHRCGEVKPHAEFRPQYGRSGGYSSYCRLCESEYQREYRERNKVRLKEQRDASYDSARKSEQDVLYKYGVTGERYASILESQGGRCAICGEECPSGRRLSVDHDHSCCPGAKSCGQCVRGLLCSRCNPGLGYFRDEIGLLRKAVAYLERHESASE